MTRAYVLDQTTLDPLGLVDQSWEKLSYTRRYFGMDTFQMTIQRARLYASTLQTGRLLYLPDEGNSLFVIEQITSVTTGGANTDLMTVSGRSMEGPSMVERLVIPAAGQDYDKQTAVAAETAMKHYVSTHAEPGVASAARAVPGLNVVASAGAGTSVTCAGRYQTVFDIVNQIGLLSGIGWEILLNPTTNEFDFDVIVGVDRSASVFFDFEFETLDKWEELESILESKTVAVVAGQGEGKDRDVVTRWSGSEPIGMARREAFLDARDIVKGATTELNQRGDSFLAAATKITRLEAGIHQYGSFRYGEHWDMGDLVLIRNTERGISFTARVVEVEKSFAGSMAAPTVTAVIDRPFPTMKEQINGAGATPGMVDYPDSLNPKVDTITLDRLNADLRISRNGSGEARLTALASTGSNNPVLRLVGDGSEAATDYTAFLVNWAADVAARAAFGWLGDLQVVGLNLGPGNAARDTNLYRESANVLATDDLLKVKHTGGFVGNIATGNHLLRTFLAGTDTQPKFRISSDGLVEWGVGGTTAADVNLYRSAAGILKTDDTLHVGGSTMVNASSAVAVGNGILLAKGTQTGHTADYTFMIYENATYGAIFQWGDGSGSGTRDTILYRSAANTLKTDDKFIAASGVEVASGALLRFVRDPLTNILNGVAGNAALQTVELTSLPTSGVIYAEVIFGVRESAGANVSMGVYDYDGTQAAIGYTSGVGARGGWHGPAKVAVGGTNNRQIKWLTSTATNTTVWIYTVGYWVAV